MTKRKSKEERASSRRVIHQLPRDVGSLGLALKDFKIAAHLAHTVEDAVGLADEVERIAELDDLALVQDEHLVVVDDGLQAMGDGKGGVLDLADGVLDPGVGGVVDGSGCFVHEEDFGSFEKGTGETEKLTLALGKVGAGLGDSEGEVAEDVLVFHSRGVGD